MAIALCHIKEVSLTDAVLSVILWEGGETKLVNGHEPHGMRSSLLPADFVKPLLTGMAQSRINPYETAYKAI